ncbi:AraC family ligand binding domain-containing protein [Methylobacterium sp. JK268]
MAARDTGDEIRLWRDLALGEGGVDLLAGRCVAHRYGPHFHEEVVIAVFTEGAQRHRIGGRSGLAVPGSVLVIPAGETHTGEAAGETGWAYRAFYPDTGTLDRFAEDLFGARPPGFVAAPAQEDPGLARRLAALHATVQTAAGEPLARQQAFGAAMAAVLERYARPGAATRPAGAEPRAMRRAMDLARARFADPALEIADLAAAAGFSPFHFMRCFRAATGMTAHAFVVQLRVTEARRRLAAGIGAAEVAQAVGFADQSHLIRHFRAQLGVTPGRFAAETRRRVRSG